MNTLEKQDCPECHSTLVDDRQNGEIICSGCGIVVHDQIIDAGPEMTGMSADGKVSLARATGHLTFSQHDLGVSTEISISSKDFSGKQIDHSVAAQMSNLRKWQQRIKVSSSRDRRLVSVLSKIVNACNAMGLPKNVLETSSMIYRNLDEHMEVKGKSVVSMTIATVYMACKQCGAVRTLDEIARSVCTPKEARSKIKLAAKYYRTMVMEMGQTSIPMLSVGKCISKIANRADVDVKVMRLALEISEKTKNSNTTDGKDPNGIAAACLYVSSILLGQNLLQRDIASTSGISEITIRNRCREILTAHRIQIVLRPMLASR